MSHFMTLSNAILNAILQLKQDAWRFCYSQHRDSDPSCCNGCIRCNFECKFRSKDHSLNWRKWKLDDLFETAPSLTWDFYDRALIKKYTSPISRTHHERNAEGNHEEILTDFCPWFLSHVWLSGKILAIITTIVFDWLELKERDLEGNI